MKPVEEGIKSWSFKEFVARQNYKCENCGGTITKGTHYIRHVLRMGAREGKDPLKNVHVHLDCHAPWYHPETDDRCRSLRQLPGRMPPKAEQDRKLMKIPMAVSFETALGRMTLELDPGLAARMLHAKNDGLLDGSLAELEQNLQLVGHALMQAAGNRRTGLKVSHALNGVQLASGYTPQTNHDLDLTQILNEE